MNRVRHGDHIYFVVETADGLDRFLAGPLLLVVILVVDRGR